MNISIILLIFVLTITGSSLAFPGISDQVVKLPKLAKQPTFKHYSGYLNGSATVRLHYWLVESERSPSKDPIVLWLNGGPGCSSLDGLLTEHGPFRINYNGSLTYNPHSWNKLANMVYLESPACVGFSYSTDKNCSASDILTKELNFNALRHFFIKFPQYKNRDFYITGESYGGYYVPVLAQRIITASIKLPVKFKGIAVGNGLSSWKMNQNGNLHFAYNHGLFSDQQWQNAIRLCCGKNSDQLHCDLYGSQDVSCKAALNKLGNELKGINVYNIYGYCEQASLTSQNKGIVEYLKQRFDVKSEYNLFRVLSGWASELDPYISFLRNVLKEILVKDSKDQVVIPCTDSSPSKRFLNDPAVRRALHIPNIVGSWSVCSSEVNLNYKSNFENMTAQYLTLFNTKDFRVLIYNGDVDMACCYLSDEWFFDSFKMKVLKSRTQWYVDEANKESGKISKQVGGYMKLYESPSKFNSKNPVTLITVRGAGHMVPTDKPVVAYAMFKHFLNNEPFLDRL